MWQFIATCVSITVYSCKSDNYLLFVHGLLWYCNNNSTTQFNDAPVPRLNTTNEWIWTFPKVFKDKPASPDTIANHWQFIQYWNTSISLPLITLTNNNLHNVWLLSGHNNITFHKIKIGDAIIRTTILATIKKVCNLIAGFF